jgi:hypothetical protein
MQSKRLRVPGSWLAVLALIFVAAAAAAATGASGAARHVKAPNGTYSGGPGKLTLIASGKSIDLAAFSFKCRATSGRTSLNGIPLRKTKKGYKFSIKTHGGATYADEHPDENAAVNMSGRFSRSGNSAVGYLRVRSPHCGDTGPVKWRARR